MTDKNKSHVEILVDRSGSMWSIKNDTEGGLKSFLAEQAKASGECTATLSDFDTEFRQIYKDLPVSDVPEYTLTPRYGTALYDALGKTIIDLGKRLAALSEDKRPGAVTVVVLTDGYENSSVEYTAEAVKNLVKQQQDDYSWNFIFMGSNQDAVLSANTLGIQGSNALTYTGKNVQQAFTSAARSNVTYRGSTAAGLSYGEAVIASAFTDAEREDATKS